MPTPFETSQRRPEQTFPPVVSGLISPGEVRRTPSAAALLARLCRPDCLSSAPPPAQCSVHRSPLDSSWTKRSPTWGSTCTGPVDKLNRSAKELGSKANELMTIVADFQTGSVSYPSRTLALTRGWMQAYRNTFPEGNRLLGLWGELAAGQLQREDLCTIFLALSVNRSVQLATCCLT